VPPRRAELPATWLVGKRVRLRPIEAADVRFVRRVGLPVAPSGIVLIVQTMAGRDIGTVGIDVHGSRGSIGAKLSAARWADGCAAEALRLLMRGAMRALPLIRVDAMVLADDGLRLRAFRAAGLSREGVLRSVIKRGGGFRDAVMLSAINET
jgi:RimJ/RimL family protein N-acetyltransferase